MLCFKLHPIHGKSFEFSDGIVRVHVSSAAFVESDGKIEFSAFGVDYLAVPPANFTRDWLKPLQSIKLSPYWSLLSEMTGARLTCRSTKESGTLSACRLEGRMVHLDVDWEDNTSETLKFDPGLCIPAVTSSEDGIEVLVKKGATEFVFTNMTE